MACVVSAWCLCDYMAYVVLSSSRLTPPWLYGLCCFVVCSPYAPVGYMACVILLFILPDACVAIWRLFCVFCLMPMRLNGMCCLFVYSPYMFCFVVCLYLTPLLAIRLVVFWFSPNACIAIWHVLFRLMPPRLYGMCCLFSPEASVAIWQLLCVFAWCLCGYMARLVLLVFS